MHVFPFKDGPYGFHYKILMHENKTPFEIYSNILLKIIFR